MKKPGIWDPFRQESPVPPKAPVRTELAIDPDSKKSCVAFTGSHYGINVWVETQSDDMELQAREQLAQLLFLLLKNPVAKPFLDGAGVRSGAVTSGSVLAENTEWAVTLDGVSPSERVGYALREIQKNTVDAEKLFAKYGVVPFIKM